MNNPILSATTPAPKPSLLLGFISAIKEGRATAKDDTYASVSIDALL